MFPNRSHLRCSAILSLFVLASALLAEPVDRVNLHIGTGDGVVAYGGTMPFVSTPFGMTNWTPQTRQNKVGGVSYKYQDSAITGFIGTHQPAIWMGDYGYVTIVPELDTIKTTPEERRMSFNHADEVTTPYYYSVSADAGQYRRIRTEITATEHSAIMRFTFPAIHNANIVVEATRPGIKGMIHFDPDKNEISGYNPDRMDAGLGPFVLPNFRGYFVVQFSKQSSSHGTYADSALRPGAETAMDSNVGAYLTFETKGSETVEVKIGTSFISIDQARENLNREIPDWNFEAVSARLKKLWNDKLGMFSIEGASPDQEKIFYTALYHAMLYPKLFSEYGHYYSAFDDKIHPGVSYTAYSIWDIFRAEHSLLTLVAPERNGDMITALLQDYREGGWLPKWPNPSYTNIMIGTHADSLIAESVNKGFHGFDYKLAHEAVYKDAMTRPDEDTKHRWFDREPNTPYEARAGLTYSKQLGYIPDDKTAEDASSTLEESYDDWCVAQVAKALGKTSDYEYFLRRSLNYKLLFNPATGFMQARNSDGSWADPSFGWTEGDKWVYTWAELHDIPGLMQLMGGADKFNAELDEHFRGGHNQHDNEPSHHYGYLYDYSGQPWKTQSKVREIAAKFYANDPGGIDGDDDCGQMSAWYIFTALGFYPLNPASGDYLIGSPLYSKITFDLPAGKAFSVTAVNNSEQNIYIQSAKLNGMPLKIPVIHYADIVAGGKLEFQMGPTPSRWAADWNPPAISASLPK
ncbi:MAG: GH92 family glycosyl hydrolase [Terracidiphilus sp.]|jgi:predicted alpha-1,2-mannosidase